MNDWSAFIESVTWFLDTNADVRVFESKAGLHFPPTTAALFPSLADLLAQSKLTPVSINGISHQLFAWNNADGSRIGWLCSSPTQSLAEGIYHDHATLLNSFGGIIERFNEPEDTWLLNHSDALTHRESCHDANFINDYRWAFTDAGVELPIHPSDYYSIAREANGNTTLCHRSTGQVILFAPDHAFDFVVPLDGCPKYTLYKLHGIGTLRDWVDTVAKQWLAHIKKSP